MNNIAIFASGSGSNAENIASHFRENANIQVKLILSENPEAFVLTRAKRMDIATHLFSMPELRSGLVAQTLKEQKIDYIILAGFLKLVPEHLVKLYQEKIINIHPALLPKFGGKGMYGDRVHRAVLEAGETETGITIHLVSEHYDEGSILFQAKCPVYKTDTSEDVAQRVHSLEYKFFPSVIRNYIEGKGCVSKV
jgi:phosphoribosylglycinamide formyltransferase 1